MAAKLISINMRQLTPSQKGLATGLLMILASLFSLYILKDPVESYFQYVLYVLFCAGILWAMLSCYVLATDKRTFSNFFSIGFKTFVVVSLLMAVFTFIYFSFHLEFRDNKIAENSRLLKLQGNHLPNEIASQEVQFRKIFMPMMVSITIFRYLIIGALVSVIAAGFLSKKKESQ